MRYEQRADGDSAQRIYYYNLNIILHRFLEQYIFFLIRAG